MHFPSLRVRIFPPIGFHYDGLITRHHESSVSFILIVPQRLFYAKLSFERQFWVIDSNQGELSSFMDNCSASCSNNTSQHFLISAASLAIIAAHRKASYRRYLVLKILHIKDTFFTAKQFSCYQACSVRSRFPIAVPCKSTKMQQNHCLGFIFCPPNQTVLFPKENALMKAKNFLKAKFSPF